MSTLSTANIQSKAAATLPVVKDSNGVEIGQFATARICFNGTGTVANRSSFNIGGITDNADGDYTLTFSNPMANNDYVVVGCSGLTTGGGWSSVYIHAQATSPFTQAPTTSAFRITVSWSGTSNNLNDYERVSVVVFGGK